MPKVRYSNKAVEDLSSIWEYTFTKWSENQADEYYAMLISACNRLLYPSVISNRSYEEISEGLLGVARCLCCTKPNQRPIHSHRTGENMRTLFTPGLPRLTTSSFSSSVIRYLINPTSSSQTISH